MATRKQKFPTVLVVTLVVLFGGLGAVNLSQSRGGGDGHDHGHSHGEETGQIEMTGTAPSEAEKDQMSSKLKEGLSRATSAGNKPVERTPDPEVAAKTAPGPTDRKPVKIVEAPKDQKVVNSDGGQWYTDESFAKDR
ncbi:MAG TPA: hypothetical protein PLO61_00790 [Fimbriimonadaceae bacterium]|nr:hypothetical protein [Fimbriimonadaceae bacterium]HRJ32435.1 hypothetical protein [Fimbriimonadaceae bacterium]